jgi:hypothetical protein
MKKTFLAMAAIGALALWTSCSNEEFPAPVPGGDGTVTFTATLPANISSRAYGDGEVAKTLHYAVYEAGSDAVVFASDAADSPAATVVSNTQFTLTLQLVKGKSYDFIFWADATTGSPYTFTSGTKSVSVSYEDLSGNNENRDAFFQTVKGLEISGPIQQPVELRRPFAQFNILTSDLAAVTATGTAVAKVAVTVKGVRNSLNLYSGIADGAEEVTFTSDALPGQSYSIDGKSYDFLAMNYLLTGIELEGTDVQAAKRELMDASAEITFDGGKSTTVEVANMPVQRNYRTNIYGALLTSPLDLTIDVKPEFFESENNILVWDGSEKEPPTDDAAKTVTINSPAELAGFAANINKGKTYNGYTVTLKSDIDLCDKPWTPAGNVDAYPSITFDGTFDGGNHVIKNLNATSRGNYASAGLFGSSTGEVKNLTIENATIVSDHYAGAFVGFSSSNVGFLVENCELRNSTVTSAPAWTGTEYDNGDKVGGIVGYSVSGDVITDCRVIGCEIEGYRHVGGIVGAANGNRATVTGCTVSNTTVTQNFTNGYKSYNSIKAMRGEIIGWDGSASQSEPLMAYGDNSATAVTLATKGVHPVVGNLSDALAAGGEMALTVPTEEIDLSQVDPAADLVLTLEAKVGKIRLGTTNDERGHITIRVPNGVEWPKLVGLYGDDRLVNLTIEGSPESAAALAGFQTPNYVKNVTFKNIHFSGKGINILYGINTVDKFVVEGCNFTGMTEPAIWGNFGENHDKTIDIAVRDNKVSFTSGAASSSNGFYLPSNYGGKVIITGNTVVDAPYHGIYCSWGRDVEISGNTIIGANRDGIKAENGEGSLRISGNSVRAKENGIRVKAFAGNSLAMTGNTVDVGEMKAFAGGEPWGMLVVGTKATSPALEISGNKKTGSTDYWFSCDIPGFDGDAVWN